MKKTVIFILTLCLMLLTACTQPCTEHSFGDWFLEEEEYVRICEVCKEKETHIHSYGEWEFRLEDMSHSCIQCGSTETLALEPELVLKELLPGHWSFSHADLVDAILNAHQIDKNTINYYLDINEDGSVAFWDEKTLTTGTWTLKEYRADSGIFVITSTYSDGQNLSFGFDFLNQIVFIPVGDYIVYLSQNRDLVPHVVGTYTAVDKDGFHSFILEDDHTITGFPDSSWHITPIYTEPFLYKDVIAHSYHFDLRLFLQQDGQTEVQKFTYTMCHNDYGLTPEELEAEIQSYLQQIGFILDTGDSRHLYHHHKPEDLELLKTYYETYLEVLARDWVSSTVGSMGDGGKSVCTDYSISFTPDGEFTANLGQKLSGTWTLYTASVLDDYGNFSFNLHCSNRKTIYVTLDMKSESLILSYDNMNIEFANLSPEEQANLQMGDTAVIGQWSSISRGYFDEQTKTFPTEDSSAHSMIVNADHTFTALLETEETGTWEYYGYEPEKGHSYIFYYDQANNMQSVIYQPDGTLSVQYEDQITWYKYIMERQS